MNTKLNVVGSLIGLSIFFLAVVELNNLVAPILWSLEGVGPLQADVVREIWSFLNWHWYLTTGAWYNMMMLFLGVGLAIFGLSLWFWED